MKLTAKTTLLLASTILPSCIRVVLYRALGFKVGRGVKLCALSVVAAPDLRIGSHSKIWPLAFLTSSSALRIGSYCQVTSLAFVYGDHELILEDGSYVGARATINTTEPVRIGPNSGVGPNSMLYTHGVFLPYSQGYPRRLGPITIEENVWLMFGVSVLPGVTIGANSIVGGGLVIAKNIPANSYVQGQSSKLRIASIDLLKHRPIEEPRDFTEELLAGLAYGARHFHYTRTGDSTYELRLGSEKASLRVLDAGRTDKDQNRSRRQESIVFLFNAGPGTLQLSSCSACFDIDRLTVTATPDRISRFVRLELNRYFGMNFRYADGADLKAQPVSSEVRPKSPATSW